jgi:LuxR family transcriptional regulator, maltose regulon positive regulatory protein
LQRLEEAGAFVISLDARRSWFRYHQLFADLLQLELRGTRPSELPALHEAAAGWYAEHGYPVEAVRQAQAAQDWALAARVLSDRWVGLGLAGLGGTVHELLTRFPTGVIAGDAELAARVAGTSWRGDRWKRPNGAWLSPPGRWSPFPRTGAAAPRSYSPSCGCA